MYTNNSVKCDEHVANVLSLCDQILFTEKQVTWLPSEGPQKLAFPRTQEVADTSMNGKELEAKAERIAL